MTNLQRISIDLNTPGVQPHVYAAAGDLYSRYIQLDLYAGGQPYQPPAGTTCVIGWRRGNTVGSYDKIALEGDETRQAWQLEGNALTIELDWHITETAGPVAINVGLLNADGGRLSTWELLCDVRTGAAKDADNPDLPSESATQAADRAEAAAQKAQQAMEQMDSTLTEAATQAAKAAVKDATAQAESAASRTDQALQAANSAATQAESAAGRAESVADQLDQILKDGPVVSVNSKTGRVELDAEGIPFRNTGTPLMSTTVQDAIQELLSIGGGGGVSVATVVVTAPAGSTVVLKKGTKSYTQTVDSSGTPLTFQVLETGTWTVTASLGDLQDSRTVNVAQAGETYSVSLDYDPFKAYVRVTVIGAPDGAMVKAALDDTEISGATLDGSVSIQVSKPGAWTITATYADGVTQPAQVDIQDQDDAPVYQVTVRFCTLTVTAPAGSTVEIKNADTTLTGTADSGSVKFWLPNTGTWTTKATLNGQTATGSVDCSAYEDYSTELSYFSATIKATAVQGATVNASLDGQAVSGEAGSDGTVTLTVTKPGSYVVSAIYKNALSNSKAVQVSQSGQEYPVSVDFITLTVTAPEGSTITAKNGATTLTDIGGTVVFYLPNTGTWTVSASLGGDSTSDSIQCNVYQNYSVELIYTPPENMNDATWSQLHSLSASGKLGSYYDVGDTKNVVLNGTVGILKLNSFSIMSFIIGINHNPSKEGNNKTHFALGKIGSKVIALCDSNYHSYANSGFCMNTNGTSNGGWASSYMRNTVLGNSGTPSSPPTNSLMAVLPSDLRAVMQPITKYTNNTGNNNSSAAITATTDYMWLLAEFEHSGDDYSVNQYEKNAQLQYDYYKSGNSLFIYMHNSTSNRAATWYRSACASSSGEFVKYDTDSIPTPERANNSEGLFSCFAV